MARLKNTEKLRSFNLPEFIQRIKDAYEEYPEDKLEGLVRMKTLIASCLIENEGRHDFKLPHTSKKS